MKPAALQKKTLLSGFVLSLFCSLSAFSEQPAALPQQAATAAEMSKNETVASALLRGIKYQEYEVRSAAKPCRRRNTAIALQKATSRTKKPQFGPAEVRTFAEQVKHVACANFAFAAELDGQNPPDGCDKGGPHPARTRRELLTYLRDSFAAIRKSLSAIDAKICLIPSKVPTPDRTRAWAWRLSSSGTRRPLRPDDLYLRQNGIVRPPAAPIHRRYWTNIECSRRFLYLYVFVQI